MFLTLAKLLPKDLQECLADRRDNIAISKRGFSLRCFVYNHPLLAPAVIFVTTFAICAFVGAYIAPSIKTLVSVAAAILAVCVTLLTVTFSLDFQLDPSSKNPRVVYRRVYTAALRVGAQLGWSQRLTQRELLARRDDHWLNLRDNASDTQIAKAISKTFSE
ncbi:MAG TPA: hypothetical protein VFT87_04235 [Candidatus Saccharimonadales bacterium]|nr:hypothetical protein [Candidatus Saccharimonadales bacterium]